MVRDLSPGFETDGWRFSSQSIVCCATIFLLFDVVLLRFAFILDSSADLCVASLAYAQLGLIGIWAAISRRKLLIRFAVILFGIYAFLILTERNVQHFDVERLDWFWAVWGAFASLGTLGMLGKLIQLGHFPGGSNVKRKPVASFNLRLMMEVTVMAACLFAAGRFGQTHWGWKDYSSLGVLDLTACAFGVSGAVTFSVITIACFQRTWRNTICFLAGTFFFSCIVHTAIQLVAVECTTYGKEPQLLIIAIAPFATVALVLIICRRRVPSGERS